MMRKAVVDYNLALKDLTSSKVVSADKVAERTHELAQAERRRLIFDSFDSGDDRTLAAAVLYKECGDSKGFAWKVARDYLILIVRAQNRGKSAMPLILDPEMDKLAFGRKQKNDSPSVLFLNDSS
ncbi:hypothetical protein MHU86_16919 [Fragilaria crotonensis]|nr:hypothetical protein MHU86_16919 [Fragilaria crotonensis]